MPKKKKSLTIPKWLQALSNATIKAAIAENPSVATASGWTIKDGEARQDSTEDPGVQQLQDNLAILGGTTLGITAAPVASAVLANPVTQKAIGQTAASMLGGIAMDETLKAITGQPFGRAVASTIGQQNVYDRSALARFGFDALNPGYFTGNWIVKGANAAANAATKIGLPKVKVKPKRNTSFKRKINDEFNFRMDDNGKEGVFNAQDVGDFLNVRNKGSYIDLSYDGRFTVSPEESFTRRNAGGSARQRYMLEHPVKSLDTPTAPAPSLEEELSSAGREFAKKYASDFPTNFRRSIHYNSNLNGDLGVTEGVILGRGTNYNAIKVAHSPNDASVLARITENHEMGHATGNMNENYIYNALIENNLIDPKKAGSYLLDADRGEISAHLSELPDYLGFTGYSHGHYTGHPFGKTSITAADITSYNSQMKKDGFKRTIWDAVNKEKMKEFVSFLNKHPFAITLPVTGIGLATTVNNNDNVHSNNK